MRYKKPVRKIVLFVIGILDRCADKLREYLYPSEAMVMFLDDSVEQK